VAAVDSFSVLATKLIAVIERASVQHVWAVAASTIMMRSSNFPPFLYPARAHATIAQRDPLGRTTFSRPKTAAPISPGLGADHFFRQRSRLAHSKSLERCAMYDELRRSRKEAGLSFIRPVAQSKSRSSISTRPSSAASVPRFQRHEGQHTAGLADRWKSHLDKKYAELYSGVNTTKAFERVDKSRDGLLDKEEILKCLVENNIHASPADLDEVRHCVCLFVTSASSEERRASSRLLPTSRTGHHTRARSRVALLLPTLFRLPLCAGRRACVHTLLTRVLLASSLCTLPICSADGVGRPEWRRPPEL
jgi:hypothetical protein